MKKYPQVRSNKNNKSISLGNLCWGEKKIGKRSFMADQNEAIAATKPENRRQLWKFIEMAGFCHS